MIPFAPLLLLFVALVLFAWAFLIVWVGYRNKVYAFKQSLIPAQNSKLGGSGIVAKLVFQDVAELFRYTWGFARLMQHFQKRYAALLTKAGNPALLVGDEYFLIKLLGAMCGMLLALIGGSITSYPALITWGLFLYLLPDYLLQRRAQARLVHAQLALPEALESLAFMLKQGVRFREALQLYVGHRSWTPLQAMLYPFSGQGQGMPVFKPVLKQLQLKPFVKMGAAVDQLEEDPLQLAQALLVLAGKVRKHFIRRMKEHSQQNFLVTVFCFLFFTIPSVAIIVFGPILIDYYPVITNLIFVR